MESPSRPCSNCGRINCSFFCRFMLCLTLWRWKAQCKPRIIIYKYKWGRPLIYNGNTTLEEALKLADVQKSKLDQPIQDVAFTLRTIIKNATRTNLPSSGITFDDIIDGEVKIPEQLTQFLNSSIWSYYEIFCNSKLCALDIMGSSHF